MLAQHSTAWPAQLASPARSSLSSSSSTEGRACARRAPATRRATSCFPPLPTRLAAPGRRHAPLDPLTPPRSLLPSPGALPRERPNATVAAARRSRGHRPPLASPECPEAPLRPSHPLQQATGRREALPRRHRARFQPPAAVDLAADSSTPVPPRAHSAALRPCRELLYPIPLSPQSFSSSSPAAHRSR